MQTRNAVSSHSSAGCFYVSDGHLLVQVGEERHDLGPGCFAWLPRRIRHAFANVCDSPVHLVGAIVPSGMEEAFAALGGSFARLQGPPGPERIAAIWAGHAAPGPPGRPADRCGTFHGDDHRPVDDGLVVFGEALGARPGRHPRPSPPSQPPHPRAEACQPWVSILARTIVEQPGTASVRAQHNRVVTAPEAKFPHAAAHLDEACDDILAFTAFLA